MPRKQGHKCGCQASRDRQGLNILSNPQQCAQGDAAAVRRGRVSRMKVWIKARSCARGPERGRRQAPVLLVSGTTLTTPHFFLNVLIALAVGLVDGLCGTIRIVICARRNAPGKPKAQSSCLSSGGRCSELTRHRLALITQLALGCRYYPGNCQRSPHWVQLCLQEEGFIAFPGWNDSRRRCSIPQISAYILECVCEII